MKKFVTYTAVCSLLALAGCGSGGSGSGDDLSADGVDIEAGDSAFAPESQVAANPIATSTEIFGREGNLYKPRGDSHGAGAGNLVVLLSKKFTEQFDSCEARLNTGEVRQLICINDQPWTHTPYSCFSNGDRQTWRADFRCSDMAEVKVTCKDENQEIDFTVPDEQKGHICTRFG